MPPATEVSSYEHQGVTSGPTLTGCSYLLTEGVTDMTRSIYAALWAAYLEGDDTALYSLDKLADEVLA